MKSGSPLRGDIRHTSGAKICIYVSKMIPEEHNGPCPWMTRQDRNSFSRLQRGLQNAGACSQCGAQNRNPSRALIRAGPFSLFFFFSNLIKTPQRLSNDWDLFIAPNYPLRDWKKLPGAVLGKETPTFRTWSGDMLLGVGLEASR